MENTVGWILFQTEFKLRWKHASSSSQNAAAAGKSAVRFSEGSKQCQINNLHRHLQENQRIRRFPFPIKYRSNRIYISQCENSKAVDLPKRKAGKDRTSRSATMNLWNRGETGKNFQIDLVIFQFYWCTGIPDFRFFLRKWQCRNTGVATAWVATYAVGTPVRSKLFILSVVWRKENNYDA